MNHQIKRRTFLKSSAAVGAGLMILKSDILKAGRSPNEKLNIAVIGVRGRGGSNLNDVKSENIVALCDVNSKNLAEAAKDFPRAKTYEDWRKCLEQKDIDAVVIVGAVAYAADIHPGAFPDMLQRRKRFYLVFVVIVDFRTHVEGGV